jgi:hypothetical protein
MARQRRLTALTEDGWIEPLEWGGTSQRFTSVRLPLVPNSMVVAGSADATAGAGARDSNTGSDWGSAQNHAAIEARFLLWGLTLSMVNDWLTVCGFRETRIDLFPIERPGPPQRKDTQPKL